MRLCLVSSIIALILTIQVEYRSGYWLVLLALVLISTQLVWPKIFPPTQPIIPFKHSENQGRAAAILLSIILSTSYCYLWLEKHLESRLPAQYSGETVSGVADVVQCDYSDPSVEKFTLELITIDQTSAPLTKLKKIVVSSYSNGTKPATLTGLEQAGAGREVMRCGFRIQFAAKLRAPYSFINPVGFDYEAWLLSKGIDATGYFKQYRVLEDQAPHSDSSFSRYLINLRQQGIDRSAKLPGLSGQVVPALLFGISGYLDKQYWSDLQVTGAIHLLVVSGLHVGFLVLIVILLWRLLVKLEVLLFNSAHSYLLRLTPLVLMVCCLTYAYMAGFGLAVQRSGLMLLVAILVSYYKSHWSLLDTLLWVAWLVLVINPLASLSIGFWFSFTAVGALLLTHSGGINTKLKSEFKDLTFWQNALLHLIKPQWIVFIALMPFLWMFQQPQSVLSLLVNTLAIPLLALLILPLSLLALCFPESIFVEGLNHLLSLGFEGLRLVAMEPSTLVFKPQGSWLLVLLVFVVVLLLFKGFPFRRLSFVIIALVYFLPLKVLDAKVVVLDVGQGLAVAGLFPVDEQNSNGKEGVASWVYDTGAKFRSGFSLGEAVVTKNLLAAAEDSLAMLFISHSDNDHAGGEAGLKRIVDVVASYAGQPLNQDHLDCHQLAPGWRVGLSYRWRIFNVSLGAKSRTNSTVNSADNNRAIKDNDASCIVQFEIKGKKLLLPGDIEERVEALLVEQYGDQLKSDVLIVPHHGSKTSSSKGFIQQVAPAMAIISSGYKNQFRHPHPSIVERYRALGITVFNTAHSGAIEIDFSGDINQPLEVIEWRQHQRPIWRQM